MKTLFIVFEGPDGAGTTTHARLLAERLKEEGKDVLLTAEPTDGPVGQQIRSHLKSNDAITPMELQKLFVEDRAWHLEHIILPALKRETIVICDRYIPSTLIYGSSLGLPLRPLQELNKKFIQPDVTIFTLPPFETCWARVAKRPERDTFEREELQRKIYDAYVNMAKENPKIHVIDTSKDKDVVAQEIRALVLRLVDL